MTQSIGVVTGGGDCPGLNAVIRAVAKSAIRRGWKAIGIVGGYVTAARSLGICLGD